MKIYPIDDSAKKINGDHRKFPVVYCVLQLIDDLLDEIQVILFNIDHIHFCFVVVLQLT